MNILNKGFWVVTKPTKLSTLADICFVSDFAGLQVQYAGGLKFDDIQGIYDDETEAKETAESLLGLATYEKFVNEFILGRGRVMVSHGFMTGAEVKAEIESQGGQVYQNVYYERIKQGV